MAGIPKKTGIEINLSWTEQLKNLRDRYGVLALILLGFSIYNGFVFWNVKSYTDKLDRQADTNLRIGSLEGKMDVILQDRPDLLKLYIQKTSSTSAE